MADISKAEIEGVTYFVKDAQARKDIEDIKKNGGGGSGGGTGGGASSWEDLGEKQGTVEALAETTWTTPSGEFPGAFKPNTPISIELDKTYTVKWNGTEYTSVPYEDSYSGRIALGNPTYVGGPTNGESYGIVIENGVITEAYDANMASSVTVSITYEGTEIIPIPTKYLPKALQFGEEEGGMVEVLAETTLTTSEATMNMAALAERIGLVLGETYTVFWNGEKYVCKTVEVPLGSGAVGIGCGNEKLAGGNDTGEPFGIVDFPAEVAAAWGFPAGVMAMYGENVTFTISVYSGGTVIHPIEGKYLPKGTPWIEENGVLMAEADATSFTHPTFGQMWAVYGGTPNLTVGETYTITYNGVDYKCVCQAAPSGLVPDPNAVAMGNFVPVGGANTGEPFAMLVSYAVQEVDIIDLVGSASVKVEIKGAIAHKIDPHCLPDAMIVNFDASTNTADKNCNEIWGAIQNNQNVLLALPSDFGFAYSPCVQCVPNAGAFFIGAAISSDGSEITKVNGMGLFCVKLDGSVLVYA